MRTLAIPALVLILAPAGALAQEAARRPTFEAMPFAGYVVGGEFENADTGESLDADPAAAFGIALRMRSPFEYDKEWEIFYSHQGTDVQPGGGDATPEVGVDIDYLHLGGTYFPSERAYTPYVLGGLGVTMFSPDGAGLRDQTEFSISLGLGIRFPVTDYFALRLEGRGFLTFVDNDVGFFCGSGGEGGACLITASGSTFLQFQGALGFAFSF